MFLPNLCPVSSCLLSYLQWEFGTHFYLSIARLSAHWPHVKPLLEPEYQLSTCQKDSEQKTLTEVLFSLLFYFFSFIKSCCLPESENLEMEGLCESLTVSVTESYHVLLLEALLSWSNGNLGNSALQMSESFS